MKNNKRIEIIIWILAAAPLIVTAFLYGSLPEQVPMHWNINGEIDSWGGRASAFYIPLLTIGLSLLLKFLPLFDPKRRNYARFGGAYDAVRLVLVLFMGLISGIVLYGAYNPESAAVNILVPAGIGLLFAVIGNFMPKFKHNYFVGVKTPWTLANEEVWRRTHRLAGVIWFWGGLLMTLSAFIIPESLFFIVFMSGVAVLALVPAVYSYIIFHRIDKSSGQ